MAYVQTGVGISNVSRTSRTVTGLIGDYGGADADEVQILNGLIALGYDPALVRSFADADPNRKFLGDAVTRALRAGVSEDAIRKALAYNKVAVEEQDPTQRVKELARALGYDVSRISGEATRLAGLQGRRQPSPEQWVQAVQSVTGMNPEAARSFQSYATFQHADFVGKDVLAQRTMPTYAEDPGPGESKRQFGQPAAQPPPQPNDALARAGGALGPGGTLGGTLGGTTTAGQQTPGLQALPTLPPNASEEDVVKYIKKWYGYSAWTLDVPELRQFMIGLAREFAGAPVDEARIEGALSATDWWKTHEGDQRLAIEEKLSDPATYNSKVEGRYRTLASLAGQIGFTVDEARLRKIAIEAYDLGWSEIEMRAALAAEFDYSPDTGAQDQSAIVADLRQIASDYLVPLSEQTIDQWGRQIIAGTADNESFAAYTRSMAKGMFAHYASDIDAGRTVKQIADPFVQMAARDLELTPDQINLEDAKWRRALEVNPETGQPMQLSQWQRLIRTDTGYGWDSTQGARGEASEFARKIAESFGRA